MQSRLARTAFVVLIAGIGVSTVVLFVQGLVALAVLCTVVIACLVGWRTWVARPWPANNPAMLQLGTPKPASAPPDGHIRFTLVVEGLEPERIAEVWSDLCRPERTPTEELRLLFLNFTVVEGRRFRFRRGDPTATAALLASVLGTDTGVAVRTHLEPAAERTPPWS
jgi:hypothetical protein